VRGNPSSGLSSSYLPTRASQAAGIAPAATFSAQDDPLVAGGRDDDLASADLLGTEPPPCEWPHGVGQRGHRRGRQAEPAVWVLDQIEHLFHQAAHI